jgi:hypothetical protein
MAGILFFTDRFQLDETDARRVRPESWENDQWTSVSAGTWREMQEYFSGLGIPMEAWPVAADLGDVSLDEIESWNRSIRERLAKLSIEDIEDDAPWVAVVVLRKIKDGRYVLFTV